jgi:hypothetical protein
VLPLAHSVPVAFGVKVMKGKAVEEGEGAIPEGEMKGEGERVPLALPPPPPSPLLLLLLCVAEA